MTKIYVAGASGMLGSAVVAHLDGVNVTVEGSRGVLILSQVLAFKPDIIINCIGVLPGGDPQRMVTANALTPHQLQSVGARLVHMSTDCVYSGRGVPNKDYPDPTDLYGRTKLAGEPSGPNTLVVRGSFIGTRHGFLRWALDATGEVEGWQEARWSGTSVEIMAMTLVELALSDVTGLVHVAAKEAWTKASMLAYLQKKLALPFSIKFMGEPKINRALVPDFTHPPIAFMLAEIVKQCKTSQ